MKALVYTNPEEFAYRDEPDPVLAAGDALVKVHAVGICGSDMHAYQGHDERRPAPLILGHEAAGVVVGGPKDGQKVVVNPLVTCGVCPHCLSGNTNRCQSRQIISMPPRQGAFAEYIAMPERNLIALPEGLSFSKAAMAEPLATSWHAALMADQKSERPVAESRALVMGGGAVGLGAALSLRAFGCADVTVAETNALRRATVQKQGFKLLDPSAGEAAEPGSMDIVIDAVGMKVTRMASCAAAKAGGVIVHVGLADAMDGLDVRRLTLQEITFAGIYTYSMFDFMATVNAMAAGQLGDLDWYEERSLAEGDKAFADLFAGATGAAKVILKPEGC